MLGKDRFSKDVSSMLSGDFTSILNLNCLLVKRQNDNPSPGAKTGEISP